MRKSPHNCPVCQRLFQHSSNLKSHLLTHTDVRPKQLMEIVDRLMTLGQKLTCSRKLEEDEANSHFKDEDESKVSSHFPGDLPCTIKKTVMSSLKGFSIDELIK